MYCTSVGGLLLIVVMVCGDVYFHVPRGSNNRLDGNRRKRRQNNRLFDSQNNNRGGYNAGGIPRQGYNPKMKYYVGSTLQLEWTNQHECGGDKSQCDVIIQYMCGDELRDGKQTGRIRFNPRNPQADRGRRGQHEDQQYYLDCKKRARNKNLYHADRKLKGNSAIYTRQNPKGNRNGLECPEERDYYPYPHPTPWKDIAILTNHAERCRYYQRESQNTKSKGYCAFRNVNDQFRGRKLAPNNREDCEAKSNDFEWREAVPHNLPPPRCGKAPLSRDNHLGDSAEGSGAKGSKKIPQTFKYLWTVPNTPHDNCALRIRYNISIGDYQPFKTDAASNGRRRRGINLGSTYGMSENEAMYRGYTIKRNPRIKPLRGSRRDQRKLTLRLAINTAQTGRTFEDRSHAFSILLRPITIPEKAPIYNVGVRGKRGNIVQVYPAVEYDFTPNDLVMKRNEYIHMQWTGSLRNPRKNDGEGEKGTDKNNAITLKPSESNQKAKVFGYPGNSYPASVSNTQERLLSLDKAMAVKAALSLPDPPYLINHKRNCRRRCRGAGKCDTGYCGKDGYCCRKGSAGCIVSYANVALTNRYRCVRGLPGGKAPPVLETWPYRPYEVITGGSSITDGGSTTGGILLPTTTTTVPPPLTATDLTTIGQCFERCAKGTGSLATDAVAGRLCWTSPSSVEQTPTRGGNAGGANCVFPFRYNGGVYSGCQGYGNRKWCATTEDYGVDGKWGFCVIGGSRTDELIDDEDEVNEDYENEDSAENEYKEDENDADDDDADGDDADDDADGDDAGDEDEDNTAAKQDGGRKIQKENKHILEYADRNGQKNIQNEIDAINATLSEVRHILDDIEFGSRESEVSRKLFEDALPRSRKRRRVVGNDFQRLNDAPAYFDLQPQKATKCGRWHYMSTRNNNFSNRSQKGKIQVCSV